MPPPDRANSYIGFWQKEGTVKGKKYTAEQIVSKLREADVLLGKGQSVAEICRQLQISDVTYYRWRKEYGGLSIDQAKRLKEIEAENTRLRKVIADLSIDNAILKEASRGNFSYVKGQVYSSPRSQRCNASSTASDSYE
jgi:putative transposase